MKGTVSRWELRGWGFIQPDDGGQRIFVHYSGIEGEGRRDLEVGQRVEYEVSRNDKGPIAVNVKRIE